MIGPGVWILIVAWSLALVGFLFFSRAEKMVYAIFLLMVAVATTILLAVLPEESANPISRTVEEEETSINSILQIVYIIFAPTALLSSYVAYYYTTGVISLRPKPINKPW
ncbi:Oidioi.mRNA.OKI2018_I69.PAR.g10672.t1.cds [Oikopleura dioica]|uniref:Oidioi.mRNA.OKI2018_I69.PAR.g10672.t1.cds n=1 Tax=Oikopleura dioica TaxID=34765 RepID=A0ABN7RW70_OIKDI|nr:Oidioi.mRNA.OKI2018_I69.PAR.g10672.t1.cds [Oikopleura dioica]